MKIELFKKSTIKRIEIKKWKDREKKNERKNEKLEREIEGIKKWEKEIVMLYSRHSDIW